LEKIMKTSLALLCAAFGTFASAALADGSTVQSGTCALHGVADAASTDCQALRAAYRSEVDLCIEKLGAEADLRAKGVPTLNAHSYRARYLNCDKTVRSAMGLAAD
jgi:hypothetical protein